MTEKEKTSLRENGLQLLKTYYEARFETSLQDADFRGAKDWMNGYNGAAFMMEWLELLSSEEVNTLTDSMFSRYMSARYPDTPKEAV